MSNVQSLNQNHQPQIQNDKLIIQQLQKAQRMILHFNKNGLQYLSQQKTYSQGFQYFKKAQKTILDELKIQPQNKKINQLAAITYNNLACYYKKTNKPKVALSYLKKALQIQVYKVQNWISTSSTHLNICAIYSYLKKHNDALQHAVLALKMLEKWDLQKGQKQKQQEKKSYGNIKMLSNYNAAIENEYLKNYQQAQKFFQSTIQLATKNQIKNNLLIKSCNQGIQRMKSQQKNNKQRLIQILAKKKQNQQKNNKQFMRKNKKNYHKQGDDWRQLIHNRKYVQYKIETDHNGNQNKKHQSLGKLVSIKPILHTQDQSKKSLNVINKLSTDKGAQNIKNTSRKQ